MDTVAPKAKEAKKTKEHGKFYKFQLFFIRIRHGLFLFTLRSLVSKIGIDVMLYYWESEGKNLDREPTIRDEVDNYEVITLAEEDLEALKNISFINYNQLLKKFGDNYKVVGLKSNGQIAAFTCIDYADFTFRKKRFQLDGTEAYLHNMYTFQTFRGKNLAPYLRYHVYQKLASEGITGIYSVTDYLNKSSIKFKRKLGAQPLVLYGSFIFFKKLHKTFKLKDYS